MIRELLAKDSILFVKTTRVNSQVSISLNFEKNVNKKLLCPAKKLVEQETANNSQNKIVRNWIFFVCVPISLKLTPISCKH